MEETVYEVLFLTRYQSIQVFYGHYVKGIPPTVICTSIISEASDTLS